MDKVSRITVGAQCYDGPRRKVILNLEGFQALEIEPEEARKIEGIIAHLKRNAKAYTAACFVLAVMLEPSGVFAASTAGMSGGKNIILLLQKASFWAGMGITIWGIVEAQLDFPGWKGRIMKGILGYIGILLVPLVFLELQGSLQMDVWDTIDKQSGGLGGAK